MSYDHAPFIVGLGGATRVGSSTERALAAALSLAEAGGARTQAFAGEWLSSLPIYRPESPTRTPEQLQLCEALRQADGVIIATPSYHAGPSGLVKNALDVLEDLRGDARPYLDDRAVGLIVTAGGWQGGGATLQALRATVHALRGWPTPLGVVLNSAGPLFGAKGEFLDRKDLSQMAELVRQLLNHASARMIAEAHEAPVPRKTAAAG